MKTLQTMSTVGIVLSAWVIFLMLVVIADQSDSSYETLGLWFVADVLYMFAFSIVTLIQTKKHEK